MPDWQGELDALLAALDVSFEDDDGSAPRLLESSHAPGDGPEADPLWSSRLFAREETVQDGEEVGAIRSEIEATLAQIVALARTGRIDRDLRDDVIFVLHALTRPRPAAPWREARAAREAGCAEGGGEESLDERGGDESVQEWHLASAAAVLRFCCIVLRLTHAVVREPDV